MRGSAKQLFSKYRPDPVSGFGGFPATYMYEDNVNHDLTHTKNKLSFNNY
jgi:hypothetical protein